VLNPTPSQPLSALSALQANFGLMKLGGKIRVIERHQVSLVLSGHSSDEIAFYEKSDGEVLMKRFLESQPISSDVKKTITAFWIDPNTHVYKAIAFSPWATPSSTLNYWVGATVTPSVGDWRVIRNHIHQVICAGDSILFEYLLNYLAHMLQFPEDKPGIMVVLLGKQGTGKGLFFQILQRIWSRTSLLVSDIQQVVGQFNGALERHYVVIMDEALFSGDRKSQDRMKSLITEKTCHIEQKYQPARTIESVHRFFASSNHDQFAHTEADDRRYLVLRVSDERQGEHDYFANLVRSIVNDHVIAALVHDLMHRNLSGFNVRQRPITKEHGNQKLMSLQGFDRYWFEVLMTGRIGYEKSNYSIQRDIYWEDHDFISSTDLVDQYQRFDKHSQKFAASITKDISDAIARLCPSAKKDRQTDHRSTKRGYVLPELSIARQEFEHAYNVTIDWDESAPEEELSLMSEEPIWESDLAMFAMTCHELWQPQPQ